MPIIKSAIKRAKQTIKRRERNVATKRDIKSAEKAFIAKPTATNLSAAQSEIDTAVKKGLIKKNTAARRKSQLFAIAKKAGVKLSTGKKDKAVVPSAVQRMAVVKKAASKPKTAVKKPAVTTKKPAPKKTVSKK